MYQTAIKKRWILWFQKVLKDKSIHLDWETIKRVDAAVLIANVLNWIRRMLQMLALKMYQIEQKVRLMP